MTTLDKIFTAGRRKGCAVCGARNAASVAIQVRELGENGKIDPKGRSRSRQTSFCADHAGEMFAALLALLQEGGRK